MDKLWTFSHLLIFYDFVILDSLNTNWTLIDKLAQVAGFSQIWVVTSMSMMVGYKVDLEDFSSRFLWLKIDEGICMVDGPDEGICMILLQYLFESVHLMQWV